MKEFIMNSIQDIKCVVLADKREIHLKDEDDISISMISKGEALFHFPIPYPSLGYDGGALYLSPSEKYLLFPYYSGQSEEAFTLFRISDTFELVYQSDYLGGEAASYSFSKDEKMLIQCLPYTCSEWWQYWEDEEPEKDEDGKLFFDFGNINLLDIEKQLLNKHIIRIYPAEDWQPEKEKYFPFMSPKMINDNRLKISMPWGEETLDFPMKDLIIFEQKNEPVR